MICACPILWQVAQQPPVPQPRVVRRRADCRHPCSPSAAAGPDGGFARAHPRRCVTASSAACAFSKSPTLAMGHRDRDRLEPHLRPHRRNRAASNHPGDRGRNLGPWNTRPPGPPTGPLSQPNPKSGPPGNRHASRATCRLSRRSSACRLPAGYRALVAACRAVCTTAGNGGVLELVAITTGIVPARMPKKI
jgi:hypothetical protein